MDDDGPAEWREELERRVERQRKAARKRHRARKDVLPDWDESSEDDDRDYLRRYFNINQ